MSFVSSSCGGVEGWLELPPPDPDEEELLPPIEEPWPAPLPPVLGRLLEVLPPPVEEPWLVSAEPSPVWVLSEELEESLESTPS